MATIETIHYVPHRAEISNECVRWVPAQSKKIIQELPQIIWVDFTPWREANLWAMECAKNQKTSIKTIWCSMKHIHA